MVTKLALQPCFNNPSEGFGPSKPLQTNPSEGLGLPSIFQQPLPTWAYATIQRVGALNGTPRQGLEVCFKRHPPKVIPTNNAGGADGHVLQARGVGRTRFKTLRGVG